MTRTFSKGAFLLELKSEVMSEEMARQTRRVVHCFMHDGQALW